MDFNKDLSRISSNFRHELANNETISHLKLNPTMHLVLEETKNANTDNNKQILEIQPKNPRISQYLSVKSTDILLKSEDLYGFHDEILQIKLNQAHIQSHNYK